jgi:preprotein translocase subunit SecF
MNLNFVKYWKFYFLFSGILILASIFFLFYFGLNFGIEFKGGSILEIEYKKERPSNQIIRESLADLDLGEITIQPLAEKGVIIRMKNIDENLHQKVIEKLSNNYQLEERRFESIGPVIGRELKNKTKFLTILALLTIFFYIAFAFGRLSHPLNSWQYGIVALITLSHDLLIPLGIFSILGKFWMVQITIPVIVALLTVLGYTINDKVVVFDRIRENILKERKLNFGEIVNKSINQTLTRNLNTSLTTLFVCVCCDRC